MTMTVLIAALFFAGATYAATMIVTTLRAYWPAMVTLRDAANWQAEEQDVRLTMIETRVHRSGDIIRPEFRRHSSQALRGLRAAA